MDPRLDLHFISLCTVAVYVCIFIFLYTLFALFLIIWGICWFDKLAVFHQNTCPEASGTFSFKGLFVKNLEFLHS